MPIQKRWSSIFTAALAMVVACSLALPAAPGVAQARVRQATGGTLIVDYVNDFTSLDTGKCYDGQCFPFMRAMFDRLIDYDTAHAPGTTMIPDAAATMPTVSNGGRTYTFALRHDVHFWNGRLVTAADWVYSFERVIAPLTQSGAAGFWMNIAGAHEYASGKATHASGIQALGTFGLRLTLLAPDASFLNVLAMPFGSVVDKNQIARYGKSYAQFHPMGTGPYMFVEHKLGQRLVLVRNPHYFRPDVGHVNKIQADLGVNSETAFLRIQRGQADLDGDEPSIPAAEFLSVLNDPTWSKQLTRQVQVGTWYIDMNVEVKPFDNVLVRRAVNMAINKSLLVRLVNGRATVTNTFLPPAMPGYGAFNLYPYNPAKARQLMAQAGYANGVSTTFLTDNVSDDPRIAQAIIPMLAAIGITARLQQVDGSTLPALLGTRHKVAITWSQYYMDFPDPNDFFEPALSCASAVPGSLNESWYCNPKVDALAHQLKLMTDSPARLRLYSRLDMMVMRDAPMAPVMNPIHYDIHSLALHNYYYSTIWVLGFADYTKQ